MHDTKIEMKLEEETKKLSRICEQLQEAIHHEFDKGFEHINVMEMGASIDMLKDIYEAKEKLIKGCYYKYILGAMEKEEEEEKEERKMMEKMREQYNEEDEDGERRFYRGQPRSKTSGRFMRHGDGRRRGYESPMLYGIMPEIYNPMEYYRDMDRADGKMYFAEPSTNRNAGNYNTSGSWTGNANMRDGREGRSGMSRRSYMETKEMHKDNTPESKQAKMRELEAYTKELAEDVTEMISDATPEEKALLKQKMQVLMQKI